VTLLSPDLSADRIRERNRHHSWLLRLPILLWLAYLLVRYFQDPSASSLWGGVNLGFHEMGHILFGFFPEFLAVAGGTLTEMAIPLVVAWLFVRRREDFGAAVALFWFATVLMGTAVYAGDARARVLPLVSPFSGDPLHDWYYMLGRLGLLYRDQTIAALFRTGGLLVMAGSVVLGARILWLMATDPERTTGSGAGEAPGESALEAEGRRFQAWLAAQSATGEAGDSERGGVPGRGEEAASGSGPGHASSGATLGRPDPSAPEPPPPERGSDPAVDQVRESVDPSTLTPEERRFLEFLDRKKKGG
jgi:hypothetical protein